MAPRVVSMLRALPAAATSTPVLVGWLALVTWLAAGPLQGLDRAANQPWSRMAWPALRPFLLHWGHYLADPTVAMSVTSVVSLSVAWSIWSLRPLAIAAAALTSETALVVGLKIWLARPRPTTADPTFFAGGVVPHSSSNTIYPSGHVANAVLIYGIAAYLLACYTLWGRRRKALLGGAVATLAVLSALISWYLQRHWVTDLLGGAAVGALILRATVAADRALPADAQLPRSHTAVSLAAAATAAATAVAAAGLAYTAGAFPQLGHL